MFHRPRRGALPVFIASVSCLGLLSLPANAFPGLVPRGGAADGPPAPAAAAAPVSAPAPEALPAGPAVLLLLPSLDWSELRDGLAGRRLPNLARLADEGALGLMNALTGGRPVPQDAYVTLGAGTRAAGGPGAGEAYDREERVGGLAATAIYEARQGRRAPGGRVLHAGLASLEAAGAALPYRVEVGALGEALHRAGIETAVIGNADGAGGTADSPGTWSGGLAPEEAGASPGRWAVAVAMDRRGAVDWGSVGRSILLADPSFPGGWRADDSRLAVLLRDAVARSGLVVVETGDLWRIQAFSDRMPPAAYAAARQRALARADTLAGHLIQLLDPRRDLLLVLSPFPSPPARQQGGVMTPILAWGRGVGHGVLTSGTTRRRAVVANLDVGPAILAHHGLSVPASMPGRPLAWEPAADPVGEVDALHGALLANYARRPALVKGYIFLQIAVLGAAMLALPPRSMRRRSRLEPLLVSLTAAPLALLLLALLPRVAPLPSYAAAIVIVAALTLLARRLGRRDGIAPFVLVAAATVAAVILDTVAGLRWMDRSPLGHSPLGGARYYGIGNEYMGILLGASLVAGTALLDRMPDGLAPRLAVLAGWAAVLAVLASPALGANFGGTLAGTAGFAYTVLRLFRWRPTAARLAVVGAVAAGILALVVVLDLSRSPEAQSHVARTVSTLSQDGWPSFTRQAGDIFRRKLSMNWRLIRWTNWSWVFLTSLGTYTWLVLRPPATLGRILARHPNLGAGFSGVAVASLAALAVNDSGIVAAATAMIFASAPMVYLVMREPEP